ncbi:MAG: helix-turn-helix domain-containing protein [Gemmatimonadaceae bacterium]
MDQKKGFVREYRRGLYTLTELAERYDLCRKSGYALVRRVDEPGIAGLQPQSRRRHTSPNRTPDYVATMLIEAKRKYPAWGLEMLLHWLRPRHREFRNWPAKSTSVANFKREAIRPPKATMRSQQRAYDAFRAGYNAGRHADDRKQSLHWTDLRCPPSAFSML